VSLSRERPHGRRLRRDRGWHDVAAWYDELVGERGSEYQREVVIPRTVKLLEAKRGERVLDVACGQGVLCRALAEGGARVSGVDIAPALIEAARRRSRSIHLAIDYRTGDARRLADIFEPNTFDAAVVVLAIQNIAPVSPVWEGCHRVLAPRGRLVVVMMHPCFRVPRASGWGWDDQRQAQYRAIEQYLSSSRVEIQIHPGSDPSQTTPTFHRPLQAYVNTLGSAGFAIGRVEEWTSHKTSPAGPRKAALDKSRKEIPLFLALRAIKIGCT
jgi:ubiquinone/menaquinone biosynthesis C-methylase UbiE